MNADDPLAVARRYLAAIEARADLEPLLHPEMIQHELPNRLVPNGAVRDRAAMLAAAEKGKKVVRAERYVIKSALAEGSCVALEVEWSAELAVPVGALPAGGTMRAAFAMFIEVREGKVVSQRNYDCFDPF